MPKPTNADNKRIMRGQFSTVIDIDTLRAAEKDGELPDEIPVLPKGEYMTLPYGNMVLNDAVFEQMIGNFKAGIRRGVPVDFDHAWENTKAAGWIKELINKADGLWARVKWNKLGSESIADEVYKMISAEWSFDYVDPQKSTHHGAVLVAATLTNRPLMQSMPTITASEKGLTNDSGIMILLNEDSKTNQKTMPTLTEILAKPVADRTEEDVKFLTENEADLTEDQKTQLETEQEAADEAKAQADLEAAKVKEQEEADAKAKAEAEASGKTPEEIAEEEAAKEAANKDVTIKASEFERLQKLEADHKASELLRAAEDFSKPFLRASNGTCKVKPAGKTALVQLAQSLTNEQRTLLASVLNAASDTKVEGSIGEDTKEGLTATEQYNNLINEAIKAGKSPAEANKEVRKAHEAIYKAFLAENN
jgi:hypothetical protein